MRGEGVSRMEKPGYEWQTFLYGKGHEEWINTLLKEAFLCGPEAGILPGSCFVYVCVCVCMYVCMYVCVYIYIYIYLFIYLGPNVAHCVTKFRNVGVSSEIFNVCILLNISLNPRCVVHSFCLMDSRSIVWESDVNFCCFIYFWYRHFTEIQHRTSLL
jgi:hypothetical protein